MTRAARRPRALRERRTESITTRYAARAFGDDAPSSAVAEDRAQRRRRAIAQVDDAVPDVVRVLDVRDVDVGVMLVREQRPEHVEQLGVARCHRMRIVASVLVLFESALVRVLGRVRARDVADSFVFEDLDRIARYQVAAIDPLTNEQRVEVRPIVVGNVELVESAVDVREGQRRPPNAKTAVDRADPERRVPGRDEEVGGGRLAGRTRFGSCSPTAEQQECRRDGRDDAET